MIRIAFVFDASSFQTLIPFTFGYCPEVSSSLRFHEALDEMKSGCSPAAGVGWGHPLPFLDFSLSPL